jgi:hypothetical protein
MIGQDNLNKNTGDLTERIVKGTLARDFGLPFFIIKRMLLVP